MFDSRVLLVERWRIDPPHVPWRHALERAEHEKTPPEWRGFLGTAVTTFRHFLQLGDGVLHRG